MMWSRSCLVAYLGVAVLASGCGAPAGGVLGVAAFAGTCGTWLCQTNSASMGNGVYFYELDASGMLFNTSKNPKDPGVRYVAGSFKHPTAGVMTLTVEGDDIVGTLAGTSTRYMRKRLKDATFVLESQTGELYDVKIAEVDEIPFWAHPELEPTPTYQFVYRLQKGAVATLPHHRHLAGEDEEQAGPAPGEFTPLCTDKDPVDKEAAQTGIGRTLAVVFTGDRYDPTEKTVTAGKSDWFNVACAGSAMAKMHLLRHTAAGAAGGFQTTVDQRQAMLKMLTDDICGTGYSFTKDGEDVYYTDKGDWHPPVPVGSTLPANVRIEAIWSKDGAVCLDEPRRYFENPLVVNAITQECKKTKLPPSCSAPGASTVGLPGLPPGQPAYDLSNWKTAPDAYGVSINPP